MQRVKIKDDAQPESISTSFININKGEVLRLPDNIVETLDEEVFDILPDDSEPEKEEEVEIEDESEEPEEVEEKYTKSELVAMRKAQQVKILEEFGLSSTDIRKLSNEPKRVEKILELQEE